MNVVSYEAGKTEGPAKVENPKNESLTSYIESLAPYLNSLKELNSGEKIVERLHVLRDCGLTLDVNKIPLEGQSFEENIWIGDICGNKVVLNLPDCEPNHQIKIPILCKQGTNFIVKDVEAPAFIAVGHELIHFIHKAEAFAKSDKSEKAINDINNWHLHRPNYRAIATLYGFEGQKQSDADDSDDSLDLAEFMGDDNKFYDNFLIFWGNTNKAYEELRTITGKETNGLSSKDYHGDFFETTDLDISERHLLSDYFTKNQLPDTLTYNSNNLFITRWTHALDTTRIKQESFVFVEKLLSKEEINKLPTVKKPT